MIIISNQQETGIYEVDNVEIEKNGILTNVISYVGSRKVVLGIYDSKDKALEILKNIRQALTLNFEAIPFARFSHYEKMGIKLFKKCVIFQMPKREENNAEC